MKILLVSHYVLPHVGGIEVLVEQFGREFARRGHEVTLFNRGQTNSDLFPDLEKIIGNRDPDVDEGLKNLKGRQWDAVIDTSGYVPRIVGASAGLLASRVRNFATNPFRARRSKTLQQRMCRPIIAR